MKAGENEIQGELQRLLNMHHRRRKSVEDRKRHKIVCPNCGKTQYACKSIFQEIGIDAGCGRCLECNGFMKLVYDADKDVMIAEMEKI